MDIETLLTFVVGMVVAMVIFWLGMEYEKDRKER